MASTSTLLTFPVASISIPSTTPTGIAVRKLPLERCIPSDADLIVDFAAVHKEPGHNENEYYDTNVNGSKNIVLNSIPSKVNEIKALNKKVIAVCRSGARSGQATSFLKQNGIDAINGGPWQNVAKFVK